MNREAAVLLVEDNEEIMRLNERMLVRAGYQVLRAPTLQTAGQQLVDNQPDLVVLDILMPDGNGLEFLPFLKERSSAPILILSCLKKHENILTGIRAGGDDYMIKPYRLDELVVRIDALWRRELEHRRQLQDALHAKVFKKGPLELDTGSFRGSIDGADLLLTPKEFLVLLALVRSDGEEMSSEQLYRIVWGHEPDGDTRTLRGLISRLRSKLTDHGGKLMIEVEYGKGYKLVETH